MADVRIREEGFAKDADKLVRRLSLVALLLSRRGQPVSGSVIRRSVEGYPTMTEEAFKRRFYEDRAELAALGIAITSEPGDDGADVFSLPADAYYLPPIPLEPEELAALGACLTVLEGRFAYVQPLRLALLSLAQGRPELLGDADAAPMVLVPEAAPAPGVLPKMQTAVVERKTIRFTYYAITRDEETKRTVDPYGLQLVAGEWYLIGRCHERDALRTFRLSRVRSRVTYATRAPHDFSPPGGFDIGSFRDRPAWQLAEPRGTARIRVAPSLAWWVQAHWAHCGAVAAGDDGSIVYETAYADARPLLSWVLGMADAAELLEPADLRARLAEGLRRTLAVLESTEAPAAQRATAVTPPRRRRTVAVDWRVEVDHFTRLTALAGYLLRACDRDGEALLEAATVRADLGLSAEELRADMRLLNLVNFGGDGALLYAELEGRTRIRVTSDLAGSHFVRPAHLSPLQADTLLLAIKLVGGQLPTSTGAALEAAAAKLRAARGGATAQIDVGELLVPDDLILAAVNRAIVERRLLAIEYWSEGSDQLRDRLVEPYLLVRSSGEWYYVCWCRSAEGTRVFRVATTRSARLLDESFTPRPEVELEMYRREGIPASGTYAPRSATIHYSERVSRWIAERQPVEMLADGSCVTSQPYVDPQWLTRHLLRFAGEARPLGPTEATADLRAAAGRLLTIYEGRP